MAWREMSINFLHISSLQNSLLGVIMLNKAAEVLKFGLSAHKVGAIITVNSIRISTSSCKPSESNYECMCRNVCHEFKVNGFASKTNTQTYDLAITGLHGFPRFRRNGPAKSTPTIEKGRPGRTRSAGNSPKSWCEVWALACHTSPAEF